MVTGERLRITLSGGTPWGFRLQGGGNFPLEVAKIRKKSHAHLSDMREGDIVLSINGYPLSGKSHQSAMDVVEMASENIVFEIARPTSSQGPSRPLDPQRQPRIIPMVDGFENAAQGVVTSARASFSTTEGNMRTDVQTNETVTKTPFGKKITKTVTEQKITRFPPTGGLSPAPSHEHILEGGHVSRTPNRTPNRSPLMWKPTSLSPSQNRSNVQFNAQSSPQTSNPPTKWQAPETKFDEQGNLIHLTPVTAPPKKFNDEGNLTTLAPTTPMWRPSSTSPAREGESRSQRRSSSQSYRSPSVTRPGKNRSSSITIQIQGDKENEDPIMQIEQAKWEARHVPDCVPKFKLDNFGNNTFPRRKEQPKKVNDPRYPMFDIPQTTWTPPKIVEPYQPELTQQKKVPPPVPPKPLSPCPSPIPFDPLEQSVAGSEWHRPGMIRPPAQPNVAPAPPPPPMPPAPGSQQKITLPMPTKFRPGQSSTPMQSYDEPDHPHHHRPDHLLVFQPKVMFTPDDDSGIPISPDKSEAYSDISSYISKKKLFSDSAFYEDESHRFPTIDEQMSMCRKIADSLTSAANKRARGARMFAKRKRRSTKWIHDIAHQHFGSEYGSSEGDVADLNDLTTELYYHEGGNKPLFSFRIPNLAQQVHEGQKMSLSKDEFERLRLGAPRVDHSAVSPNVCFSIAQDLHKGGRNKGAKLFHKRQARMENFVIDESNVQQAPFSPQPRLEQIIHTQPAKPNNSPWTVAAHGFDQNRTAQMQVPAGPRHNLSAENQPTLIGGKNYNTVARGWQSAGPSQKQQSYYREDNFTNGFHQPMNGKESDLLLAIAAPHETSDPTTGTQYKEWYESNMSQSADFTDSSPVKKSNQYTDYNRPMQAWSGSGQTNQQSTSQHHKGDYNRPMKAWSGSGETNQQSTSQQGHSTDSSLANKSNQFGDYNRPMKAWSGSGQTNQQSTSQVHKGDYNRPMKAWPGAGQPTQQTSQRTTQSYSEVNNYNSLPRGFGSQRYEIPSCDF